MSSLSSNPPMRLLRWPTNALHMFLSMLLIFGLSYVLGRNMLTGSLSGDGAMHVGYAVWLDQYFPNIPHWYPLQGGGASLLHGYPIFSHLLVVLVHRLSGISILQAFRLISFTAMPLTAFGIYLFCWASLKKQTLGLIAGGFFLLAPVTWTWMHDWGFFAQQVGIIFLPLALIAFNRAFNAQFGNRRTGGRRTWIVALVVVTALASLCHPLVGAAIAAGMGLYVAFATVIASRGSRGSSLRGGAKVIIVAGLTVASVLAVYFVPFFRYGQMANREGLNDLPPASWHQLPILEFFGLRPIESTQVLTRMQFPLTITILALVGCVLIIGKWKRRQQSAFTREITTWTLVGVLATIYTLSPWLVVLLQKASPLLVNFFNFRSLLILDMVLISIIAAYGAWGLASWSVLVFANAARRIRKMEGSDLSSQTSRIFLASVGSIAIAWVAVGPGPRTLSSAPWVPDYGPNSNGIDPRDIWDERPDDPCFLSGDVRGTTNLCQIPLARENINLGEFGILCAELVSVGGTLPSLCSNESPSALDVQDFLASCEVVNPLSIEWTPCAAQIDSLLEQLLPAAWPALQADGTNGRTSEHILISELFPDSPGLRIDVSPHKGRLAQDLTAYTGTSQIPPYTNQLSLIHLTWGYQIGEFYADSFGTPETVDELAKWLGINYAVLDPTLDSLENFSAETWDSVHESERLQVLHFTESLPLASALTRPVILVISAPENGVYHGLFRLANGGVAPYDEFAFVEGGARVDSYTAEDLEPFDAVLLQGYDYKNSDRAWSVLENYVSGGGSIYVDTGWQFAVPEWEFEQAPSVLPVDRLTWTSYGPERDYTLGHEDMAGQVDVSRFSPLIWEQDSWSVSGAGADSLRDWAEPVLSAQGNPLIVAGEFEQGRVIWSGMNFISHLIAYSNAEEQHLLHNLLAWLVENKTGEELAPPAIERAHPDIIDFTLPVIPGNITWLYWRESYYPNWRGQVIDEGERSEIPIFRAGPGFMLMPVESESDQVMVELDWQPSGAELVAVGVSLLGGLFLAGLTVDGLILGGNGLTWLKIGFVQLIPKPFLGEGANLDWAERKRNDMHHDVSGVASPEQRDEDVLLAHGAEASKSQTESGNNDGDVQAKEPDLKDLVIDDEKSRLLASWLEDVDHPDESWVQRVLGKEETSQEN